MWYDDTFPSHIIESSIGTIVNFSVVNPLATVAHGSSLQQVIDVLSGSRSYYRLHRVLVQDVTGKHAAGLLSQRDIVKFAGMNVMHISNELLTRSVKDLNMFRFAMCAKATDLLKDGLSTLFEYRYSGIGLIDNDQRLVGNLGIEDFREIDGQIVKFFNMSILSFLTYESSLKPVITCQPSTTFMELLKLFFRSQSEQGICDKRSIPTRRSDLFYRRCSFSTMKSKNKTT